ncbi:MAG: arsinothricin resistance N-acetyltransferase ArsN1 family A [Gemmatimonadota bacterium]
MTIPAFTPLLVRPATLADAADIATIYNAGIATRNATFETIDRSKHDVRGWFNPPGASHHPFLVAERPDRRVAGWGRASEYRPRDCYASIAEFSVYVAADARRGGVGDTLLTAFLDACASAGITKLVARVFPENSASRALGARHAFREVGTYERHGKLDGRWRDVVVVERLIRDNMT